MQEKTFFNGNWKAIEKIGEGSFGIVYKAEKSQYGVTSYSAIKQILIPQSNREYSSLKSEGMTEKDIEKSYESQAKKWIEEIKFLNQFKDNENIVSIEDYEVLDRKDITGKIINIRMELLQNVDDNVLDKTITDKKVLKMALDILKALEECEEKNVVHRDIKPDNVFINSRGIYKLGDFGEAKSIEKTVSNMSKKGTENYMAPEIYKGERGSKSVDTYSLGIMLYKYFNNNRIPFLPNYPNQINYEDRENAILKRMSGEKMPVPVKASNNIARIILKACSYNPEDRYKSAKEFKNDIEKEYRDIQSPIKLFDFQEGQIEKETSISEYDKTTGIFDDSINNENLYDKTIGIFLNQKSESEDIKVDVEHIDEKKQFALKMASTEQKNEGKKQFDYENPDIKGIKEIISDEEKKRIEDRQEKIIQDNKEKEKYIKDKIAKINQDDYHRRIRNEEKKKGREVKEQKRKAREEERKRLDNILQSKNDILFGIYKFFRTIYKWCVVVCYVATIISIVAVVLMGIPFGIITIGMFSYVILAIINTINEINEFIFTKLINKFDKTEKK